MEGKKEKKHLENHHAEQADVVREISLRILRHSFVDINEDVQLGLEKIAEFVGADHAYICFINDHSELIDLKYVWSAKSVSPKKQCVDHDHVHFMSKLKSLDPLHISDINEIPESARVEAEYFENHQIKSLLITPIETIDRSLAGYLAFEALSLRKAWSSELHHSVKFFGEILFNSIQKARIFEFVRSERDFGLV